MNHPIKQKVTEIPIPAELRKRSEIGVKQAKMEMTTKPRRPMKQRLAIAVLSACLIIPTGAFAYQTLLADELYGSFEQLKKHAFKITMESYLLFNAKLDQAQGDLGKEEFDQFKSLLKTLTGAKVEYGNENGNIDYTQLPAEPLAEIKAALYDLQPYFDKLNGQPSSKELLTAEEYERYIEALMTYETAMAQAGVSSVPEAELLPEALQAEFAEALDYIRYVDELQMNQ